MTIIHVYVLTNEGIVEKSYDFLRLDNGDDLHTMEGRNIIMKYDTAVSGLPTEDEILAAIYDDDREGGH